MQQQQKSLPANQIPVQLKFDPVPVVANGGLPPPQAGQIRGPVDALDEFAAQIIAFIEAEKRDELERGHVTTFDYPQRFANYLIGKRGETINKYREEFDVDIQVKDGKVAITGPKAKAEAAKSKILTLAKKLEDESTHVLKIDPRFHRELVGPKGSQVNRLQERYNVRVQFPRHIPIVGDERSVADDASESSGPKRRPNQGPDEVIVRGPSRGADQARDELLSLLQWTKDNSHNAAVSVAQKQLPSLIGQGGQELESIQLATGARIDVPGRETADASGRVQVQIKGTKKQVEEAKKTIEGKAKQFDDTITRTVDVDKKYHSAIIGSGGANIRNIVVAAGGSEDRRDLARTVRFPKHDSADNAIRVEGNKALVDKIVAAIEVFGAQKEGQVTETIIVAPEKHRLLIGRGGESRRALESKFNVGLDIPKLSTQGPERSHCQVDWAAFGHRNGQSSYHGSYEGTRRRDDPNPFKISSCNIRQRLLFPSSTQRPQKSQWTTEASNHLRSHHNHLHKNQTVFPCLSSLMTRMMPTPGTSRVPTPTTSKARSPGSSEGTQKI